jgi:cytochrome P450
VLDMKSEMSALVLDCLERSIFRVPDTMRAAMITFFAAGGRIDVSDIIRPDFIPRISQLRARALLRAFDAAVDAAIAARQRKLDEDAAEIPWDLLGFLLAAKDPETGKGMSMAEVKANVFTFFFAASDSTSTALTWALYLLSQSVEWQARVAAESERELGGPLAGVSGRLVATRAVLDEALRLYPPFGITRVAERRDELGGHSIERGTVVTVSTYVLHRHKLLWEDPDVFDPARFLPGASRPINRYAYLPFGIGPRVCIGATFALREATLALAAIMRNFTLALAPGQSVWPVLRFTLQPRDPVLMTAKARN